MGAEIPGGDTVPNATQLPPGRINYPPPSLPSIKNTAPEYRGGSQGYAPG